MEDNLFKVKETAKQKIERIKGVIEMAEDWANLQLMPEGQLCMAALKDVRRIVNG